MFCVPEYLQRYILVHTCTKEWRSDWKLSTNIKNAINYINIYSASNFLVDLGHGLQSFPGHKRAHRSNEPGFITDN